MKPVVWPQYPFSPLGVRNMGAFPYLPPYELGGWGALCTCSARESVFGHIVFFLPLQAKWWVPLMPNLRVTCIQPQPVCFRGYRRMGCTLREPGPEKFIREGSSGSRKL